MPTEAEIYRDVALAAIKSSWGWRIAWLVLVTIVLLLLLYSAYADQQKMAMLRDLERRTRDGEKWDQLITQKQHSEILKQCTRHHMTPIWDDYPQIPAQKK